MENTLVFYINTIGKGGAERVLVNLANCFYASGSRVVFITSFSVDHEYVLADGIERINLETEERSGSFLGKNLRRIRALRQHLKHVQPQAVISFMAEANFRAVIATRFLESKVIISIRNDPDKEYASKLFRVAAKLLYPFADGYVFQTEDARMWFTNRNIRERSTVLFNQVDEHFYSQFPAIDRRGIVAVGRLEHQKNHKLLIDAFARVIEKFPEETLYIYGEGTLRAQLTEQIKALGIEQAVQMPGEVSDIEYKVKDAKVFVLSSDYEGMPNALMETMALGVPTVATDCPCGGARLLLENGNSGLLVPVGAPDEMAASIMRILGDSNFAYELATQAQTRAEAFRPAVVFEQWNQYLRQVIDGRDS